MSSETRKARPRLKNAPLVFVLAQVRIAPVLRMETHVPEIQDRLRQNGLPRFKELRGQQLVLGPSPEVRSIQQWIFSSRDQTSSVVLSSDFIVLESSAYTTFDDFSEELAVVLNVIGEIAKVELAERIGLRYVDVVRPALTGGDYRDYLQAELHGLDTSAMADGEAIHRLETRAPTKLGTLVVKVMHSVGGGFLPPDIDGSHLAFPAGSKVENGERVVILDIDHFSEEPRDFRTNEIMAAMWDLHGYVRKAFEHSVTETAIERWNPVGTWNVKKA